MKGFIIRSMELIFEGQISAKALMESKQRKIETLIIQKDKRSRDIGYLKALASKNGIMIQTWSREEIDAYANSKSHGGILVKAHQRPQNPLPAQKLTGYLCMIDGVEDPYNLGSIARTLYASGCEALILKKRDWSTAEPTILKASAGAFERLPIYWIQNEEELVTYLKTIQIPLVIAHRDQAKSVYDYTFPKSFCLAIGGALRGLKATLIQNADQNLVLDYGREFRYALDTASVCSAISFEIVRQRRNHHEYQ